MKRVNVRNISCHLLTGATLVALGACTPSSSESVSAEPLPSSGRTFSVREQFEPIEVKAEAETVSAPTAEELEPAPTAIAEPAPLAEKPDVHLALEHNTPEVDFLDRAHRKLDEDDLVGAFMALRKHFHDQPETTDVLLDLASIGRRLGEYDIAEVALTRAEKVSPTSIVATELARLYLDRDDREAARKAAQRAIRRDRTDPAAFNLLGRIEMAESQWQRAELAFRHALELEPTEAIVHNNVGLLYIRMRRGASAVDALETAVELFGDEAPHFVFNNLGLANELNGDLPSAREAFEEALLVQPFYSRAKVNLERVERSLSQRETEQAVRTAHLMPEEPVEAEDQTVEATDIETDSGSEDPDALLDVDTLDFDVELLNDEAE